MKKSGMRKRCLLIYLSVFGIAIAAALVVSIAANRSISRAAVLWVMLLCAALSLGVTAAVTIAYRRNAPVNRLSKILQTSSEQDDIDYLPMRATVDGLLEYKRRMEDTIADYEDKQRQQELRDALVRSETAAVFFEPAERYVGAIINIASPGPQFGGLDDDGARGELESAIGKVAAETLHGKIYSCSMPEGFFLLLGCDGWAAESFADEIQALMTYFEQQLEVELEAVVCEPVASAPAGASACWWHCRQLWQVKRMTGAAQRLYTEADRLELAGSENVIPKYVNQLYSGTPSETDVQALLEWCFTPDDSTLLQIRFDTLNTLTLDAARCAGVENLLNRSVALRDSQDVDSYTRALRELWDAIGSSRAEQESEAHDDIVEKLRAYLQKHYADYDLSIGRAAEMMNYNHSRMTHLFKEQTGQSPLEYLTQLRLQKAKEALLEGCTIRDAAAKCGFLDGRALGVVFKKSEGISPTQWLAAQVK